MDEYAAIMAAREDPSAFGPLYETYADLVWRYAMSRLHDVERASEATSITFSRALVALPSFRPQRRGPETSFRPWLMTIAYRVVIDLASDGRRTAPLDPLFESRYPSPESLAITNEEQRQIQDAISKLTPTQRRIVELRFMGFTANEIAEILDMSPSAINTAHFRAFRRLRQLLAEYWNDAEGQEGQEVHAT